MFSRRRRWQAILKIYVGSAQRDAGGSRPRERKAWRGKFGSLGSVTTQRRAGSLTARPQIHVPQMLFWSNWREALIVATMRQFRRRGDLLVAAWWSAATVLLRAARTETCSRAGIADRLTRWSVRLDRFEDITANERDFRFGPNGPMAGISRD